MSRYEFDDDEPYVVIEQRSGGVGSFLLGLAVGAGVALLFAPRSGAETRRHITRSARRVRRAAEDAVGDVTDRVSETFESARERVEARIAEARDALDVKREQVERAVLAGREAAQQARVELEQRLAETKAAYNAGRQVARDGAGLAAAGGAGTAAAQGARAKADSRKRET